MRYRFMAGLLASVFAASLLAIGAPRAHASSKGRRNTAIGLGALAAYELLNGKTTTGLVAAAGAAYAYKRFSDARKNDRRLAAYSARHHYYGGAYPRSGVYGRSGYQYDNRGYYVTDDGTAYGGRHTGPYTTDEWGTRHYYDPRASDGYHRYGVAHYRTAAYRESHRAAVNSPPGWQHGRKRGWNGQPVPPGQLNRDER